MRKLGQCMKLLANQQEDGDDGYAFCQLLYKGIEGEDWEEMYDAWESGCKEAVGSPEGTSFVGHESSQWRALLFPSEERADGPQGVSLVWAKHPSRSSKSMCLDRSAHDD